MSEFILLKDATNKKSIIVRKSMICNIKEGIKDGWSVRVLHYIDDRGEEYIENTLLDIFNTLKED